MKRMLKVIRTLLVILLAAAALYDGMVFFYHTSPTEVWG